MARAQQARARPEHAAVLIMWVQEMLLTHTVGCCGARAVNLKRARGLCLCTSVRTASFPAGKVCAAAAAAYSLQASARLVLLERPGEDDDNQEHKVANPLLNHTYEEVERADSELCGGQMIWSHAVHTFAL